MAASDDGATLLSDVYAFHVNLEQRAYIDAFGAKVLPQLVR